MRRNCKTLWMSYRPRILTVGPARTLYRSSCVKVGTEQAGGTWFNSVTRVFTVRPSNPIRERKKEELLGTAKKQLMTSKAFFASKRQEENSARWKELYTFPDQKTRTSCAELGVEWSWREHHPDWPIECVEYCNNRETCNPVFPFEKNERVDDWTLIMYTCCVQASN